MVIVKLLVVNFKISIHEHARLRQGEYKSFCDVMKQDGCGIRVVKLAGLK